ncbi:peptidoglycan-binding protein [Streptomyces sp. NPDC002845]
MAAWKALPGTLDPQGRQLVAQLRSLKDRCGLSLAALERRTTYSRSSWERYLNGKKLPPREAVKELALLAGGDVHRLLAMHSLAEETWSRGAPSPTEPADHGEDEARDGEGDREGEGEGDRAEGAGEEGGVAAERRSSRDRALPFRQSLTITLLTAALTAAGLIPALHAWGGDDETGDGFVLEPGRTYGCTIHRRNGTLYAGHSQTQDAVLFQIKASWDVVEAQCLLEQHGYPVGDIDGAYDARTARAVKRFQEDSPELAVDGLVGPHTWKVLRR